MSHLSSDFIWAGVNQPLFTSWHSSFLRSIILVTELTNCSYSRIVMKSVEGTNRDTRRERERDGEREHGKTNPSLIVIIIHNIPPIPHPCRSPHPAKPYGVHPSKSLQQTTLGESVREHSCAGSACARRVCASGHPLEHIALRPLCHRHQHHPQASLDPGR